MTAELGLCCYLLFHFILIFFNQMTIIAKTCLAIRFQVIQMRFTSVPLSKRLQTMGITQKTVHSSVVRMLQARRMSFMTRTLLCLRFVFEFSPLTFLNWQRMDQHIFTDTLLFSSRRKWTSDRRFPLCSAAWSPTPTSRRESRSMRRRRAVRPHAKRLPRSVCTLLHIF